MKPFINGLILNIQFLSAIPLAIEVPVVKKNIERAVQTFPILGLIQGAIYAGTFYFLSEWTPFSALSIAFFIWLLVIILTGGLHLDGWIDCSDAYFSYGDKAKRLQIMVDSHVGAFGILSVIVLLATRFLFIYEVVFMANDKTYFLVLVIPFFSKWLMGTILTRAPLAKQEGMAYFYQKAIQPKTWRVYAIYIIILYSISAFWFQETVLYLFIMLLVTCFLYFIIRRKALKWFGGITGDVTGAAAEGAETCLWMIVWLFHYYVMG